MLKVHIIFEANLYNGKTDTNIIISYNVQVNKVGHFYHFYFSLWTPVLPSRPVYRVLEQNDITPIVITVLKIGGI